MTSVEFLLAIILASLQLITISKRSRPTRPKRIRDRWGSPLAVIVLVIVGIVAILIINASTETE